MYLRTLTPLTGNYERMKIELLLISLFCSNIFLNKLIFMLIGLRDILLIDRLN